MHDQINCKKSPTGSLPPAVPLAITPTFRPWTHTSDDSYIYQLSLVVATATASFLSEVYDLFQLLCVLSPVFICFPPEVIFRSRVTEACPVTTDCIVAMSYCENNNNITLRYVKLRYVSLRFVSFRYINVA